MDQPRLGGVALPPLPLAKEQGEEGTGDTPWKRHRPEVLEAEYDRLEVKVEERKTRPDYEQTEEAGTEPEDVDQVQSSVEKTETDRKFSPAPSDYDQTEEAGTEPEDVDQELSSVEKTETACKISPAALEPDVQSLVDVLELLGIPLALERHKLKHQRLRETGSSLGKGLPLREVYCKNLLLKDKKGQAYLLLVEDDVLADLRVVKYHLKTQGNLYFASRESLWNLLRVPPGAVSPLALLHPSSRGVRVFVDAKLVQRIDSGTTKLYFHPLRADLQVGLTLRELERFLDHHQFGLEVLPSVSSYSAKRRYTEMKGGHRFLEYFAGSADGVAAEESTGMGQDRSPDEKVETEKDTEEHTPNWLSQQEGTSNGNLHFSIANTADAINSRSTTQIESDIPCKCVYLKDKRDNYFLFICHENQKVDFSNLKTQLKPKKKITPLDQQELSSLLQITEEHKSPFPLFRITTPRFLVAVADNLYEKKKATLVFRHPSDSGLCLRVCLKELEASVRGSSHDLTTIPVKGDLGSLQTGGAASSEESQAWADSSTETDPCLAGPQGEEAALATATPLNPLDVSPASNGSLFYRVTFPLRGWLFRLIRRLVHTINHYLPGPLSGLFNRLPIWHRMLEDLPHSQPSNLHSIEGPIDDAQNQWKKQQAAAKLSKLTQLVVTNSEMPVTVTETRKLPSHLQHSAESCKTVLLSNTSHMPFVLLCTEDLDVRGFLRRLNRAFKSRSKLALVTDHVIRGLLGWRGEDKSIVSWTNDDINPLALLDLDLQALGRVKVGMTGAMYSFPDTPVCFHLPPLGVTLHTTSGDLEKLLRKKGFCLVYLP